MFRFVLTKLRRFFKKMRFRRNYVLAQAFIIFLIVYLAKRSRDRQKRLALRDTEHNVRIPEYVDHNAGVGLFEDSANGINEQSAALAPQGADGAMKELIDSVNNKRTDMFEEQLLQSIDAESNAIQDTNVGQPVQEIPDEDMNVYQQDEDFPAPVEDMNVFQADQGLPVPAQEMNDQQPGQEGAAPIQDMNVLQPVQDLQAPLQDTNVLQPEQDLPEPVQDTNVLQPDQGFLAPVQDTNLLQPDQGLPTPVQAPIQDMNALQPDQGLPAPIQDTNIVQPIQGVQVPGQDANVLQPVQGLPPPAPPAGNAAVPPPPSQNPPTYHFPVPGEELPLGDLAVEQQPDWAPNIPPVVQTGGLETEIRQDSIANLDPARFSLQVTEEMINNFQIKLPPLLENYKNPCWIEETPDGFTYDDSYFNTCHYIPHTDKLKHGAQYKAFENVLLNRTARGNRARVRCFPYFFLIGVGKCGTTDVFDTLKKYFFELAPIFLKEPHYWEWKRCIDRMLCRGSHRTPTFAEYLDSFDSSSDYIGQRTTIRPDGSEYHDMIIGDFTPSTLAFHPCWRLMPGNQGEVEPKYINAHYIKAIRPETKFIAIMRDPVERIFSNFRMRDRMSADETHRDAEDFHAEMSQVLKYLKNCMLTKTVRACAYSVQKFDFGTHVTNSMYEVFISDWLKLFPREQFLFIKMEDYMESRVPNFRKIVDFLGLEPMPPEKELMISSKSIVNRAPPAAMFNETRFMLQDFFRSFNQRLAVLLDDDSWTWGY